MQATKKIGAGYYSSVSVLRSEMKVFSEHSKHLLTHHKQRPSVIATTVPYLYGKPSF